MYIYIHKCIYTRVNTICIYVTHIYICNYIFFYFYTNGCFAWMYVYHMHAGRLETRKGVRCPESGVSDGLNHVVPEN